MENRVAVTWATLAFLVIVCRGVLRSDALLPTVQLGLGLAVAFMVVGFVLGRLARVVVEESLRADAMKTSTLDTSRNTIGS